MRSCRVLDVRTSFIAFIVLAAVGCGAQCLVGNCPRGERCVEDSCTPAEEVACQVDSDCNGAVDERLAYQCAEGHCKLTVPLSPLPDAGERVGRDGGATAPGDGGIVSPPDARPDSGVAPDATDDDGSLPGPDTGTDTGVPDSGTPDSGTPDSGAPDGGPVVGPAACLGDSNVVYMNGDNNPDGGLVDYLHPGAATIAAAEFDVSVQPYGASAQVARFDVTPFDAAAQGSLRHFDFSTEKLGTPLAVGSFPNAARYPFEAPGVPGLSVYGDGRACNSVTGSFELTRIRFEDDMLAELQVAWEQHCEGAAAKMLGCLHWVYPNTPPARAPAPIVPPLFDPDDVYVWGTLDTNCSDAIAHWSTPDSEQVGFDCAVQSTVPPVVAFGSVVYRHRHDNNHEYFRVFSPDAYAPRANPYPVDPVGANDRIIPAPGCTQQNPRKEPDLFFVRADGSLVYTCQGDRTTLYAQDGTPFATVTGSQPPIALGPNDEILGTDFVQTGTVSVEVSGIAARFIASARRGTSGFWALVGDFAGGYELWAIAADGQTTVVGAYPPDPTGVTSRGRPILAANGDLFQLGSEGADGVIIRKSTVGVSEIVYTEASNPKVKLGLSAALFTGP